MAMKVTVTSIELKDPMKFFALSHSALKITRQLKSSNNLAYKSQGFWTKHYTMTLWKSEEDLKSFVRSGAHLEAMKTSASIAKEIRTVTIDTDRLPHWKEAKALLKNGKILVF